MSNYTDLLQNVQSLKAALEGMTGTNSSGQNHMQLGKRNAENSSTDIRNVKPRSDNSTNQQKNNMELWIPRFGEIEFFGNVIENYDCNPDVIKEVSIFDSHCHLDRIFFGPTNEPGMYRNIGLGLPKSSAKDMGEKDNKNLPNFKPLQYLKSEFPETFGNKFEGCISNCCDPEYWESEKLEWLMQEPDVRLSIGCHPSKAPLYNKEKENFLKRFLKHDKVVALGEIGLDQSWYTRGGVTKEDQLRVFKSQIEIAENYEKQKPIILHLRGDQSIKDAFEILSESRLSRHRRIHMHCIGATSMNMIEKWMQQWPNMMFGITSNYFLMEVGSLLPLDRLLLETDAPYFVPKKYCEDSFRGKPKHPGATGRSKRYPIANPGMVFHTAAQIAKIRNISVDDVIAANRRNIETCYSISRTTTAEVNSNKPRQEEDLDSPQYSAIIETKVDWNDWSNGWGNKGVLEEETEILNTKAV